MYSSLSPLQATRNPIRAMCIVMLLLLCGWNAAMAGDRGTKSDKVVRKGADIYRHYCSVCHGDKGDGQSRAKNSFAVPPRNYTTPESAIELTRERMIASVTHGRPGTAMIAWRTELTEGEIEAVVDHIRKKFMKLDGNTAERAKPSDKLLASRGGVLYMQACVICHGETGKRMTSGRMQPPPTDFTLPKAASELTRKRMIASVTNGRPGTAMLSYGADFSKADIEAMVDFIREAFMSNAKPKK
ncbi:MAG: c-type cytochrome [Gallionella sp.]